jgi:hypothetical protein
MGKGWLEKYADGGYLGTTNKGFAYNPAWNGSYQNGGNIPGSVGFTYARTGSTPSNGKYAKKTLPSAQNGRGMQYYQQGLDFKPKTISQNGSRTKKATIFAEAPYEPIDFFDEINDQTPRDSTFITEGNKLKEWYRKHGIEADVLPVYGDRDTTLVNQALSQHPTSTSLLGHMSTEKMAGLPLDFWNDKLSKSGAEDCYLGTCEGSKVAPYLSDVKNLYHSGQTKWGGINPYGKDINNAFFSIDQFGNVVKPENLYQRYAKENYAEGGIVHDNRGYWNPENRGKVVQIDSPDITMEGVEEPLWGVSDRGDVQYMEPGGNYHFRGKSVIETPMASQGANVQMKNQLENIKQLLTFENLNKKMKQGGWLEQYNI